MCLLVAIGGAEVLKAPFPWFGGKSRAAALIWAGLGDVPNYVEPFAGSLAVLLGRPTEPGIETVNDADMYLANFWRAVHADPEGVAFYADWPVNEADLHARHRWLVRRHEFRERMKHDPDFYDVKIAGWWVWGISMWIGGGWCASSNWEPTVRRSRGTNTAEEARRPNLHFSNGVHSRQIETAEVEGRPSLVRGKGVHARSNGSVDWEGRGAGGARRPRGVQTAQMPRLGGSRGAAGAGVNASAGNPLIERMQALAVRLRRVRVCCGDWTRVLGRSVTECIGDTAIVLDPPYLPDAGRDPSLYAQESATVARDVRRWAIKHGKNPRLRIVLCGYEGEHKMPRDWECVAWKAGGGYAASAGNHENAHRERLWFSPACAEVRRQRELFEELSTGRVA